MKINISLNNRDQNNKIIRRATITIDLKSKIKSIYNDSRIVLSNNEHHY